MSGNLSANVKESFASALGLMAATWAAPTGPANALFADQLASEIFKNAYDAASAWSQNQDWGRFFDYWDSFNAPDLPPNYHPFDLDMYRVPGMPSVVDPTCNRDYTNAQNWRPARDPLVLALNGGGISTVGINPTSPILFDHDGDGVKTGTGWLGTGEGILALDLSGNGVIDSGRELFGDNTLMQSGFLAGQLASNGFQALSQYDSNSDGKVSSLDAVYSQLRIWQDANQDGISQATELTTLAQQGVAGINLSATQTNTALGEGNTQTWTGSFTRTDGDRRVMKVRLSNFLQKKCQRKCSCLRIKGDHNKHRWQSARHRAVGRTGQRGRQPA